MPNTKNAHSSFSKCTDLSGIYPVRGFEDSLCIPKNAISNSLLKHKDNPRFEVTRIELGGGVRNFVKIPEEIRCYINTSKVLQWVTSRTDTSYYDEVITTSAGLKFGIY